jgi:hypothetical protein
MSEISPKERFLFSKSRVVTQSTPPVVVVGLPRSGSSYMAHVLSSLKNWYVFDDLYPLQRAQGMGLTPSTDLSKDPDKLKAFVHDLTWQLRAKIRFEENFDAPDLTWDDTHAMEEHLIASLDQSPLTWPMVLEEWMTRLAKFSGDERWGWKTPQDFFNMDLLVELFPGVKFIYIVRDPRKMMRSFKNLPRVKTHGSQDGESRQYHPFVYAMYWKKAYETVNAFAKRGRAPVETVRFEDLVSDPDAVASRLAEFMETTVDGPVGTSSGNSSVKSGDFRDLTATELAICNRVAGSQMAALGYDVTPAKPGLSDLGDLIKTTFTFTGYQTARVFKDSSARSSVGMFLKSLWSRKEA